VRPLPRVHAITDAVIMAAPDFGIRAAAIAAGGAPVALHVRDRSATAAWLTGVTLRVLALARPPEAAVFVNGRPDIAAAVGAHGVQLGAGDLTPADARAVMYHGWIGRSVHSATEANTAAAGGADFLMVGNIYETPSHPERRALGLGLITDVARVGLPVIAIGGVTVELAGEVKAAGAYGVAAIRSLWWAPDPAAATMAMLAPWLEDA
jgi:thiamine-phosphate diphosphorylase